MKFMVSLTHSADDCWAGDEHVGKASELTERLANAEDTHGVEVHGAHVAPNEHTFYLALESGGFESVTSLLGPPVPQDHTADVVPVTTIEGAMEATDVE